MDDPIRPSQQQQSASPKHHQQQQHPYHHHHQHQQQQQQQQQQQHQQQQENYQPPEQDNQQPSYAGSELVEATISTLLLTHVAKPQDYQEILPKFSSLLKSEFENRNLWLRFGLSIALSKDSPQSALQAFNECMRIDQDDPLPAMLAAKISLVDLNDPKQALRITEEALRRCKSIPPSEGILLSRCYVLASIAYAHLYEREPISIRQETHLQSSLDMLELAQTASPEDHLVYFHKALHEAKQRLYTKAIDNLRRAIQIKPYHLTSTQLLILCLSALRLYDEALTLCESILAEYENNLILLYFKCNLEQSLVETKGYKVALGTAQHMLKCFKQSSLSNDHISRQNKNYSSTTTISVAAQSTSHQVQQHSQQASNTIVSNYSNLTANSTVAGSASLIANTSASGTHASNNMINVPTASLNPAGDTKQVSNLFANESWDLAERSNLLSGGELSIWILVAEIFVKIGSVEDAEMCVDEGSIHASGALSHQVMYIRGLIAKAKNLLIEAKTFFQSSLALCPKNSRASQQMAHVHYLLGNYSTAEKFLKDSLDLDPDSYKSWYYLSLVYIEMNQHDKANECVKKSTMLEETSPSVPFSAISRLTLD